MEKSVIPPNPTKIATKWALINALTSIVITYVIEFLNVEVTSPVQYLSHVAFIAFLVLAQKEFKESQGGFISYGTSFSTGFRYSLFTGLLLAVFMYLYYSILSPHVYERIVEYSASVMEKQGMSAEDIEKTQSMSSGNRGPMFSAFGVAVGSAIFGAIVSLITSSFMKKERSAYDIIENASDPE